MSQAMFERNPGSGDEVIKTPEEVQQDAIATIRGVLSALRLKGGFPVPKEEVTIDLPVVIGPIERNLEVYESVLTTLKKNDDPNDPHIVRRGEWQPAEGDPNAKTAASTNTTVLEEADFGIELIQTLELDQESNLPTAFTAYLRINDDIGGVHRRLAAMGIQ